MRDASGTAAQSAYTYVSNTLSWVQQTNIGASAESITSYNVYRKVNSEPDSTYTLIQTIPKPTGGFPSPVKYIDDSNTLVAGTIYKYQVSAVNVNGDGPRGTGTTMRAVVFPTQTSFAADPSGNAAIAMRVTNASPNGFPLANYAWDYSYNGTGPDQGFITSNPYKATDVSNGVTYSIQAATKVKSDTSSNVFYTTTYSPIVNVVPYNPVMNSASDPSLNPLTVNGQPSGSVIVSWTNPSRPFGSSIGDGDMKYQIFRAIAGPNDTPVDASYVALNSYTATTAGQRSNYTDVSGVLGTSYKYKIVNQFVGAGSFSGQVATSSRLVTNAIIPFVVPTAVRNLQLLQNTARTTDISYSFLRPDSSGGLPLEGYIFRVSRLSDGLDFSLNTGTTTATSGLLSTLANAPLVAGNKYGLTITPYVEGNTGQYVGSTAVDLSYNGPSQSNNGYTVPVGIDGSQKTIANAANGVLLSGISLNWSASTQYQDMDASNASFKIYKNASVINTVTNSSYLDPSAIIGVPTQYQVRAAVGGIDASYVVNQVPTLTSLITRVALPQNVTVLATSDISLNGLKVSWTAVSAANTGVSTSSLRYYWVAKNLATGVIDASNVVSTNSATITGLTAGGRYEIMVCSGIENPADQLNYFNTQGCPTINQALYAQPPQAQIEEIYPSAYLVGTSGALLADIVPAQDVSGLTFFAYKFELATDVSFTNIIANPISTASEFYISGLNNGTTYYGRAINIYRDANNNNVLSPVSNTEPGTPQIAPNQPTGVSAETLSANSVTVQWDFPSGIPASLYSVKFATDPSNLISDLSFVSAQSFNTVTVDGVLKYTTVKNDLSFGVIYYVQIIAANQNQNGITVSQPSEVVAVVPYSVPGAVQNYTAVAGQTNINTTWLPPQNAGGAGIGLNGQLLYQTQITTNSDGSFNNPILNVVGLTQPFYQFTGLLEQTTYRTRVRAYFAIQGNPNNLALGAYNTPAVVQTQTLPAVPELIATTPLGFGTSSTPDGQTVTSQSRTAVVSWNLDTTKASTAYISRKIMNPSGTQTLQDYTLVAIKSYSSGTGFNVGSFIDTSANPLDPSGGANFLDGNRIFYQMDISYSIPNSDDVVYTDINANTGLPVQYIVTFGQPLPTDISGNPVAIDTSGGLAVVIQPLNIDSSGTFTRAYAYINKNGADLNSLVFIGLSLDGAEAPVDVESDPTLNYSNTQVNGKIAQNQYARYTVDFGTQRVYALLAVIANPAGALIMRYPFENGPFGNN